MRPTTLGNWATVTVLVEGSTVDGPHNAVLLGGGGIGGLEDDEGEIGQDIEAFGAPGIVWRPRVPEEIDGETVGAELVALRASDSLLPASVRDLRWNRAFPAPKPGTVALVGYGGGFFSQDDTDSGDGTVQVIYCPYAFSGGVATKAHSIIVDPDEESITIVHGDGFAVVLQKDEGITLRADGTTFINLKPGKCTIVADSINLRGCVAAGADTVAAVALNAGSVSPSFYVSTV